MTAYRIVTDHEELENAGQLTHAQLDDYVFHTGWVIASGSAGPHPPAARQLIAGNGITVTDTGPGGQLVVAQTSASGSSGSLTPVQHELLLQLVHLADEDGPRGNQWASGYFRTQGPFPFPTSSIWWTNNSMTTQIVRQDVVRNSMKQIVTSSWKVFQTDGVTVADSFTDLITYSGVFEISRTRITP